MISQKEKTVRIVVVVIFLIVIANLAVILVRSSESSDPIAEQPAVIEQVLPSPNSVARPLETVTAELQNEYTGVLQIDGQEIPLDQLNVIAGQGIVSFRPGEGKDIEEFDAGEHTVTVVYWKEIESRENTLSYTWSFRVG